jgi:hypothetical protein
VEGFGMNAIVNKDDKDRLILISIWHPIDGVWRNITHTLEYTPDGVANTKYFTDGQLVDSLPRESK